LFEKNNRNCNLLKRKFLNYTIISKPAKESGFVVYVPSLPGCHTQEETLDEAYCMSKDAIYGYIKTLQELEVVNR